MTVHLSCWILMLGGVFVALEPDSGLTKPKNPTYFAEVLPSPKKEASKVPFESVFTAVKKVYSLLRNTSRFIKLVRDKVVRVGSAVHSVKKLKDVGKKIYATMSKLLEYLKPWQDNNIFCRPLKLAVQQLKKVKGVIAKVNKFSDAKSAADKEKLKTYLLCCGDKCPCDPLEDSPPIKGFLDKVMEAAEKLIAK